MWQWYQQVANAVLARDPRGYKAIIEYLTPFDELVELGSDVDVTTPDLAIAEATVWVNDDDVVPTESVSLTATGKLKTKKIPAGEYHALYQDYVCGCVLRVARELFALLPLQTVLVHAVAGQIDSATGHEVEQTIVSVALPRERFVGLNFEAIDCSDAVSAFPHRMKLVKTKGFKPVEPLTVAEARAAVA